MASTININKVSGIAERIKDAKSIVIIDYKGVNVEEDNILRKKMRESMVDYFITKNTLLKIALHDIGIKDLDNILEGPTAVAVSKEDEVAPARELSIFLKENMKDKLYPSFKAGYLNGSFFDSKGMIAVSKLPTRDRLVAEVVGGINAPIVNFVFTLKGIIDRFVFVIDGISSQDN